MLFNAHAPQVFQLTSLFENSSPVLAYGYIEDIGDGRGYTFSFIGFCTGATPRGPDVGR